MGARAAVASMMVISLAAALAFLASNRATAPQGIVAEAANAAQVSAPVFARLPGRVILYVGTMDTAAVQWTIPGSVDTKVVVRGEIYSISAVSERTGCCLPGAGETIQGTVTDSSGARGNFQMDGCLDHVHLSQQYPRGVQGLEGLFIAFDVEWPKDYCCTLGGGH